LVSQLIAGERPIRTARQHWTIFIPVGSVCVVALVAGLTLLKLAPGTVAGRSLHDVKLLIAIALVLAVAAAFSLRWLRWHFQAYMLTDHRIVVSRGVLSRYSESIALDRIQNSAVRRGLLARVLGYGDVEVESAGRDGAERLAHIAHAEEFANELLMAVEARRTGRPYPSLDAASGAAPSGYAPPGSSRGDGGPESYSPPLGYPHPRDRDGL